MVSNAYSAGSDGGMNSIENLRQARFGCSAPNRPTPSVALTAGCLFYIPQKGTGKLDDCLSAEQKDRLREALGCGLRITFPLGPYRRYRRSKRRRQRGYELLGQRTVSAKRGEGARCVFKHRVVLETHHSGRAPPPPPPAPPCNAPDRPQVRNGASAASPRR